MRGVSMFFFVQVYIRSFLCVLFSYFLTGCSGGGIYNERNSFLDNDSSFEQSALLPSAGVPAPEITGVPDSLSIEEYMSWLHGRSGITYAETGNQYFNVSLLYRPEVLEAAMAGKTSDEQESQSDYLYFELSWLDRKVSVHKTSGDKERLAAAIRESLLAETGSGVVYNTIVEVFPPVLLNQPGKMLVLVPRASFRGWIELRFRGERMGLEDAVLRLTGDDIKNLPKLKL